MHRIKGARTAENKNYLTELPISCTSFRHPISLPRLAFLILPCRFTTKFRFLYFFMPFYYSILLSLFHSAVLLPHFTFPIYLCYFTLFFPSPFYHPYFSMLFYYSISHPHFPFPISLCHFTTPFHFPYFTMPLYYPISLSLFQCTVFCCPISPAHISSTLHRDDRP